MDGCALPLKIIQSSGAKPKEEITFLHCGEQEKKHQNFYEAHRLNNRQGDTQGAQSQA